MALVGLLPKRPRWHRLAVEIGCAAVLIAAVIALGLFGKLFKASVSKVYVNMHNDKFWTVV